MIKSKFYILMTILTLVLVSLACSIFADDGAETVAPAPESQTTDPGDSADTDSATTENQEGENAEPEAEAETEESSPPEDNSNGDPGPDSLNLDDPDLFKQPDVEYYRESLLYTFSGQLEDGSPVTGTVNGLGAFSQIPMASTLEFYAEGNALMGAGTVFTFTQIETTSYYYTQDTGCITFQNEDADNPYENMLDTGGILGGTAQRVMPDEIVNGVDTYQFQIDATTMDYGDPTTYDMEEIYDGRINIAKNGGYVVRLWIEGLGQSEVLSSSDKIDGDIYYELNFFDFNVPVEIKPPTVCPLEVEVSSDFPIMSDAFEYAAFPGLISYKSYLTFDEVVEFYRTEMENLGYSLTQDFVTPPVALFGFSKDGKEVQVTISEDEGFVAVGIIEPQE
jgi:hypothetical protein